MLCYKCGKDTEEFNGCKCKDHRVDNYQKNLSLVRDNGFLFDDIRKEWFRYEGDKRIVISEQSIKTLSNISHLLRSY